MSSSCHCCSFRSACSLSGTAAANHSRGHSERITSLEEFKGLALLRRSPPRSRVRCSSLRRRRHSWPQTSASGRFVKTTQGRSGSGCSSRYACRRSALTRSRFRSRQSRVASRAHSRQWELRPQCIPRLSGKSSSGSQREQPVQRFLLGAQGFTSCATSSGERFPRGMLARGSWRARSRLDPTRPSVLLPAQTFNSSGCAAFWSPVPVGARSERRGGKRGFLDGRLELLFQVTLQPASRDPRMSARVLGATSSVSSSVPSRLSCGSSCAAARAATTLRR